MVVTGPVHDKIPRRVPIDYKSSLKLFSVFDERNICVNEFCDSQLI